jgi:hypothetical protein
MDRAKYISRVLCLVLTAVLFLGLVQWSFLPLLVDGRTALSGAVLTVTGGHTAKFAAPFKCPFSDSSSTCLPEARQITLVLIVNLVQQVQDSPAHRDNIFHSDRLFRAPPSA